MAGAMAEVLLGLGSNLGDPRSNLRQAIQRLASDCRIQQVSPFYRTEPVGYHDQDWFLNGAVRAETALEPAALLERIAGIEQTLGRQREVPDGPRTIDIDILLVDDLVVDEPRLAVPHPRMHLRRFVLAPAAEIAPEWVHPILRQTLGALLEELHDPARVELFSAPPEEWGS